MKRKLKQVAEQLQDGSCIDELLNDKQVALIGRLDYEDILDAVKNDDDAQSIFWAAAQNLAGEQIDEYLPPLYRLQESVDSDTPQGCADEWNDLDVSDKQYYDAKWVSLSDVKKLLNRWVKENGGEAKHVAKEFLKNYSPEDFRDFSLNEDFLVNLEEDRIIVFSRETDNVVELTPNSLEILEEWEPQKGLLRSEPVAREEAA